MTHRADRPVALVTGGSRGIGAATALLLGRAGYNVGVNYRADPASAAAVARRVEAEGGAAFTVRADVASEPDVLAMCAIVDEQPGALAALVNNAGIVSARKPLAEMEFERIQRIMRVNVTGCLLCAREAVRRMSTRHGGRGGAIVNVSSAAARIGSPDEWVDYAASKGAVDAFTLGLAKEEGPHGVRVNAVRPGLIETDIHASGGEPDRAARLAPRVPARRSGTAPEVARCIAWLLSEEASYVNGALLDVAGGR